MSAIVTVQDLLNDFRANIYADLNDSVGLNLVNSAHRRIVKATKVRTTTRQINLTANTREYASSNVVERYWKVLYVRGAQDYYELEPTVPEEVDRFNTTASDPTQYYLTTSISSASANPYIGFDPVPGTTTGTYPYVLCYTSEATVLALSDNLPQTLLDFECYTFDVARAWAERNHGNDIQRWDALAERALVRNVNYVQNLIPGEPPRFAPGYLSRLTTI